MIGVVTANYFPTLGVSAIRGACSSTKRIA